MLYFFPSNNTDLAELYMRVRRQTLIITAPLEKEDFVVQPMGDVSPPKWHLGHTTWFFENFVLKPNLVDYIEFDPNFNYIFNSYYESLGAHVIRTDRGNLSRPTVDEVTAYRHHVDLEMSIFLAKDRDEEVLKTILLGLNHEEQHQELLLTDIKYILGHNPLFPAYSEDYKAGVNATPNGSFAKVSEGIYYIGAASTQEFTFDNESNRHRVYLNDFEISQDLVSNGGYLEFIKSGGYGDFRNWHADGWKWVNENRAAAPLYWHQIDGQWHHYTYHGLQPLELDQPLSHINYYEAFAYASWKGMRLPTEPEWEAAALKFSWGTRWEWTESAYLPYPGYKKANGAVGEYNGKFMIGQQIVRGASELTAKGHSRITYRNFFPPQTQWQMTGIRLVK
jgi:ergothioneine biosynthesis protein EgtB